MENKEETVTLSIQEYNKLKNIKQYVVDSINESIKTIVVLIQRKLNKNNCGTNQFVQIHFQNKMFQAFCFKLKKYGILASHWKKKRNKRILVVGSDFFLKLFKNCSRKVQAPTGPLLLLPENIVITHTKSVPRKVISLSIFFFICILFTKCRKLGIFKEKKKNSSILVCTNIKN